MSLNKVHLLRRDKSFIKVQRLVGSSQHKINKDFLGENTERYIQVKNGEAFGCTSGRHMAKHTAFLNQIIHPL